jgi:hypothetical protein
MYADSMRLNLPCDKEKPHGAAGCQESPYKQK